MRESLRDRIERIRSRFHSADTQPDDTRAYREITADLREQSLDRHEKRIAEVTTLHDSLKRKLLKQLAVALLLMAAIGVLIKQLGPDYKDESPQNLAYWIQQQQLLEQVAKAQQWLNEGEAESDLPPPENMEELRAWLDQIRLSPDLQTLDQEPASGEPGFVPFQCPASPIQCMTEDIPSASGSNRNELSHLVRNANTMLVDNGDCDGTVDLIGEYDSMFGWRKSEAITKSLIELSVAGCFMDMESTDKAGVHYQRAYCASVSDADPHQAMNALYGMAKIAWIDNDMARLNNHVQCSESLLDYHLRTDPDTATLNNYITLSLMYYELTGDTRESIRLEEKALDAARELAPQLEDFEREDHLEIMLILQMNLMEGYLTLGESDPMYKLHNEIKANPMLEDGDRLVARGLLVMQDLIDGRQESARQHLSTVINRYKALNEFTTVWSWEAFDRWQEKTRSTRSAKVDEQVKDLRLALSRERPDDALQKLYRVLASIEAN